MATSIKQPTFIDLVNAPELSDEELFRQFQETKDRELLGTIYRKYMALVFGVCMKYFGEKTQAQDATMEVFERLMLQAPKAAIKNFRAYLYVMTKHHCLMKKRGEKVTLIEISEKDMEIAMEVHPIDAMEAKEKALKQCLDQLKDLQKTCVEAFYLGKRSYLQISEEMKITLNAVKSHIQNGKRNLKQCLETDK